MLSDPTLQLLWRWVVVACRGAGGSWRWRSLQGCKPVRTSGGRGESSLLLLSSFPKSSGLPGLQPVRACLLALRVLMTPAAAAAPTHAHSPHQACSRASSTWPSARDACWRGNPRRVMVPSSPNHRRASVGPGVVRSWRSLGARSPSTTPRCQVNSLGERSAVLWVFQQVEVDEHAKAQVCAGTRTSQGQWTHHSCHVMHISTWRFFWSRPRGREPGRLHDARDSRHQLLGSGQCQCSKRASARRRALQAPDRGANLGAESPLISQRRGWLTRPVSAKARPPPPSASSRSMSKSGRWVHECLSMSAGRAAESPRLTHGRVRRDWRCRGWVRTRWRPARGMEAAGDLERAWTPSLQRSSPTLQFGSNSSHRFSILQRRLQQTMEMFHRNIKDIIFAPALGVFVFGVRGRQHDSLYSFSLNEMTCNFPTSFKKRKNRVYELWHKGNLSTQMFPTLFHATW